MIAEIEITDRCEKDGARAYVATTIPHANGLTTLYWCLHHFRQYETALTKVATEIRNESEKVLA